jgi:hypothetical protein
LTVVEKPIINIQLQGGLRWPVQSKANKVVEHVFLGLLNILQQDRIHMKFDLVELLPDIQAEVVSGIGALFQAELKNVGDL